MEKIIIEYKRLKRQLVNEGCEKSIDEVMWNDGIMEAMDELLSEVNDDIAKQIRLNLI